MTEVPMPCASSGWIVDGAHIGALRVPEVDCRRRLHGRPVRPLGGLPTATGPVPWASSGWTADGADIGDMRVPEVECRRRRHRRPERPRGGLPTAPTLAPRAFPAWTTDGDATGALCVPEVDCRRRRHRHPARSPGGLPTASKAMLWQSPFYTSLPLLTPAQRKDTIRWRRTQCGANGPMTMHPKHRIGVTSLTARVRLRDKRGTELVHLVVERDCTSTLSGRSLSVKHATKSTPSSRLDGSFRDGAAFG